MRTRIKICGIRNIDDARCCADAGADAIGFVFVRRSPRYIQPEAASGVMADLPPMLTTVGLFQDASIDRFIEVEEICPTIMSQLHGAEDDDLVRQCGPGVIKGLRFDEATIDAALARWDAIEEVDAILVDGSRGGEGIAFDWAALAPRLESIRTPVLVAGGLTPDTVGEAIRACRPWGVDVSSGVESSPGVKDHALIRAFCQAVRDADHEIASRV
ncbi:MAG: phosphoribosylanthranilate isomerase [Phycisphaerales bacterium]|nr:phosphoribosylanthranilate isomerase [Phycisphaerales bacterium]